MLVTIDCLSLAPPYDDLLVNGVKTIETRTWRPLKQIAAYGGLVDKMGNIVKFVPFRLYVVSTLANSATAGLVIGSVELYGVRPMTKEDAKAACVVYRDGLWAWLTRDNQRLASPFRAGPGALWIQQFEVDDSQLAVVAYEP